MKRFIPVSILSLALLSAIAGQSLAADKVPVKDLPPAVLKVIQDHLGSAKHGDVTRSVEDGETYFETEVQRGGEPYAMSITPDGKWFSIEIELSAAPPPVQAKAKQLAGGGIIDNVIKCLEEGDITFETEVTIKDRYHSYVLGPRGKVWSHSEAYELAELPAPVQNTIQKQLGGTKLGDIYRVDEKGKVYFSVEATRGGKDIGFSVAPGGKFLGFDE